MQAYDLREWCGKRYKWRYEEAYKAEKDTSTRGDGRWYVEVLCQRGLIYPFGGDELLAFTSSGDVRTKLKALGLKVHQSGDKETVFRFPAERLKEVASVLRPRRRRMLTPEQREEAVKRLHKARLAKPGGV